MNFFNQSRIGVDEVSMTQIDLQDRAQNQYMLQPFDQDCAMRKPIEFATSQVNVNFCAAGGMGNQCGVGGCNIDFFKDNGSVCDSQRSHTHIVTARSGTGISNATSHTQCIQIPCSTGRYDTSVVILARS